MNLVFRLFWVLMAARFRKPLGLFEPSVLRLRVWLNDLDFNRHMNNGRYLTVMDLGRLDMMARMGTLGGFRKRRWMPVVAAQTISFKRSLTPLERYELTTRLLCWDERFLYLEQVFAKANGKVAARALVRAAIVSKTRSVKTEELFVALGIKKRKSPPIPPGIKAWALAAEWMDDPHSEHPSLNAESPLTETPALAKAHRKAEMKARKKADKQATRGTEEDEQTVS
ncbi:thioesterase family protein [Limibacillus sp. MBR-115]|jgi:acyl-CoA thioesterase FadM|uniref:thioesterase family protein n=1 Tax=Limibacillus sp. MBR-115 TaxID=3156465 RepID=UPI003396482E